jgi:hypothetical protein
MPVLRNINPLGYVDVPLIGREGPAPYFRPCGECEPGDDHEHTEIVDVNGAGSPGVGCLIPGEEFTVSAAHAEALLRQAANYEPVDEAAIKIDARINPGRHEKKSTTKARG